MMTGVALAAVVGGVRLSGLGASESKEAANAAEPEDDAPHVEVVLPTKGGIERKTAQPGSVHSFETVELYAMVSGYLKNQAVDIGSRVKKGEVLAEIDVPKERNAVNEAAAGLEQAKAQATQARSRVKAMEAASTTAKATVTLTIADIDRFAANRRLAEVQYNRVRDLSQRQAVDNRLVDEQARDMEAAVAAEKTAHLAVETAKSKLQEALANVQQAQADVAAAEAAIGVAEARLASAKVDIVYSKIVAPFDGVVTKRNYHPGSFIRSAATSSALPVLTVSRTDLMRVVIRVPDRDVVLANAGDAVLVTIDGLEGKSFKGEVARVGESEDPTTRTMRVEVDLPNPDGLLREGMYGRASIDLEPPSTRLTVPSACVIERLQKDQGVIRRVVNGKVEDVQVKLGADNGKRVEILSVIDEKDEVIFKSGTTLEPGMAVVSSITQG